MRIIQILISIITIFLSNQKKEENTPVRLAKPKKKPKKKQKPKLNLNKTNILIIVTTIIIFSIIVLIVFKTGSMESTRLYNNRLI